MRDLQTMAGSLLLDKIWKAGWKVENEQAFWRYNEKREAMSGNQTIAETNEASNATAVAVAATA